MHKHYNGLKTALLFGGLFGVLLLIGGGLAVGTGNRSFILIFGLIGLATTAYSYWNSDKIAIRAMQAHEVSAVEAPEMYRIVNELSQRAGQPMPRLYISPTQSPNAFATGRNPENAAVCCTAGILQILSERELRGVLSHELMHVYNRDILTGSVASAIAGMVSIIGQMVTFGGMYSRDRRSGGNVFGIIVAAILAPIAAGAIQMAISRTREFDADEDGSKLTGDPLALASALRKIERGVSAAPLVPTRGVSDSSHLMIANPFRARDIGRLFNTHPPMPQRIARLEAMAQTMSRSE